jgi:hypothetical protein
MADNDNGARGQEKNENSEHLAPLARLDALLGSRPADHLLYESEILAVWPHSPWRYKQVTTNPSSSIHYFEQRYAQGRGTQVNSGRDGLRKALVDAEERERSAVEGKMRRSAGWRKPPMTDVSGSSGPR